MLPDDADEALDKILKKFDTDTFSFTWKLEKTFQKYGNWPWAIVFYKEEFRLAGHVVSKREKREDIAFTYFRMPIPHTVEEYGVPSVSLLLIYSKDGLSKVANRSELFKKAWDQLCDCNEERRWICIAESPSKEWVKKSSENDDQLFLDTLGFN
jgi:hypothetical protein